MGPARAQLRPAPERDSPVGRSFAILRAIREVGEPTTLSEIARRTGLPKSTAHRLLAELLVVAAVHKTNGQYELGQATQALAGSCDRRLATALRRVFRPLLTTVHTRTRYLVGLAIAVDSGIEWIDLRYDQESITLIQRIEENTDLCASAAGKALLAHNPTLIADSTLPTSLISEMAQIRRNGRSVNLSEARLGIMAMAVPLFRAAKQPIAALSIGSPRDRFQPEIAQTALRTASLHAHGLLRHHLY